MGDLTKRLSRHEFACKCGCGFQTVDIELPGVLESAADWFHRTRPPNVKRVEVIINSGCRCVKHNAVIKKEEGRKPIKGKPSEHVRGWAGDVRFNYVFGNGKRRAVPDDTVATYFEKKYPNKYGMGRYKGRFHLDMRPYKARWDQT